MTVSLSTESPVLKAKAMSGQPVLCTTSPALQPQNIHLILCYDPHPSSAVRKWCVQPPYSCKKRQSLWCLGDHITSLWSLTMPFYPLNALLLAEMPSYLLSALLLAKCSSTLQMPSCSLNAILSHALLHAKCLLLSLKCPPTTSYSLNALLLAECPPTY